MRRRRDAGAGLLESMPEDNRARMLEALTGLPDAEREHFGLGARHALVADRPGTRRADPTPRAATLRPPRKLDPGRVRPLPLRPRRLPTRRDDGAQGRGAHSPVAAHDGIAASPRCARSPDARGTDGERRNVQLDHVFGEASRRRRRCSTRACCRSLDVAARPAAAILRVADLGQDVLDDRPAAAARAHGRAAAGRGRALPPHRARRGGRERGRRTPARPPAIGARRRREPRRHPRARVRDFLAGVSAAQLDRRRRRRGAARRRRRRRRRAARSRCATTRAVSAHTPPPRAPMAARVHAARRLRPLAERGAASSRATV